MHPVFYRSNIVKFRPIDSHECKHVRNLDRLEIDPNFPTLGSMAYRLAWTLLIKTVGPPRENFHNELSAFAELVPCTTPRPEAFKSRVKSILIPTPVPPKTPHRQCIPTNPQQVLPMALPEGIMFAYSLLGTFLLIFVESPQLYSS
jgi:hypothetical protein